MSEFLQSSILESLSCLKYFEVISHKDNDRTVPVRLPVTRRATSEQLRTQYNFEPIYYPQLQAATSKH
jgi:hypothetical protein